MSRQTSSGSTFATTNNQEVEPIVNKSFLILDQIQESYFPLLEKFIFAENSTEKENKAKISKLEFVIQQRIKYVEDNCTYLEEIFSKSLNRTSGDEKCDIDPQAYRLNQLRCEQKRILAAFKNIKHKRSEKERVEKEQEELLTRRFTAINDSNSEQFKPKFGENVVLDLSGQHPLSESDKTHKYGNKVVALSSKLRNQKPLVKRVRTRYLNFSTDFFIMTKMFLKYSCVDCILIFGFSLVILTTIFCFIVWKTSPRHHLE